MGKWSIDCDEGGWVIRLTHNGSEDQEIDRGYSSSMEAAQMQSRSKLLTLILPAWEATSDG